jgi:hypothetical protein
LSPQTSFTYKVACAQDGDHCFFASIRHNRDFDFAIPDVKERIRHITLGKDHGVRVEVFDCLPFAEISETLRVQIHRYETITAISRLGRASTALPQGIT